MSDGARPVTPFGVLHICMGNICRSPMAERLLVALLAGADVPADAVYSHSAGTGGWHVGQPMSPPSARQVEARGGEGRDFTARQLHGEHLDGSDLVLTATADQLRYVLALRPDIERRAFVFGQFGRLLGAVDPAELPPYAPEPEAVFARAAAIVAAADAARSQTDGDPQPDDDLDDPWGTSEATFSRVADEIEATLRPFVSLLVGGPVSGSRHAIADRIGSGD